MKSILKPFFSQATHSIMLGLHNMIVKMLFERGTGTRGTLAPSPCTQRFTGRTVGATEFIFYLEQNKSKEAWDAAQIMTY